MSEQPDAWQLFVMLSPLWVLLITVIVIGVRTYRAHRRQVKEQQRIFDEDSHLIAIAQQNVMKILSERERTDMITPDGKLFIFEPLEVDRSLPKFKTAEGRNDDVNVVFASAGTNLTIRSDLTVPPQSLWERIRRWLRGLFGPRSMTPREFFQSIKSSWDELAVEHEAADRYEKQITEAHRRGQVALREILEDNLGVARAEARLISAGERRYLEEADLIRLVKKSERGIRLDRLRNFTRIIPDRVITRKDAFDVMEIFDAYAVLHYDPDGKGYAKTQAEVARRRDPILFGLVRGSRRLYFVGDWVDEHCDLTLRQVVEILGEDAVGELDLPSV